MNNDINSNTITIAMQCRFPISQTGPRNFELQIPINGDEPVLHSATISELRLSEAEVTKASIAALRAIAIVD